VLLARAGEQREHDDSEGCADDVRQDRAAGLDPEDGVDDQPDRAERERDQTEQGCRFRP
jgi:hypothetical protein